MNIDVYIYIYIYIYIYKYMFIYIYIYVCFFEIISQTALAFEGFLLRLYRIGLERQDFPLPPTCPDLPRLA